VFLATAALAAWSLFLLDSVFLDPLPWSAGRLGVVLLLIGSVGASLLSGWRRQTLLLLAACGVGLVAPSASLMSTNKRWWSEYGVNTDDVIFLLFLAPPAILLGALASRLDRRAQIAGLVVLALPLAMVGWAGFRHAYPIDVKSDHTFRISYPRYRGVAIGQHLPSALAVLGRPDSGSNDNDLMYGRDVFEFTSSTLGIVEIGDPGAETIEGVGIGDSLSLAKSRLHAACYYTDTFKPICYRYFDTAGLAGIEFIGDPIERIRLH
jgi:hypothetical protein